MSKSARIRWSDLRQVFRLVNEIVELGSDAAAWRHHLVAGLHRLFAMEMAHAWVAPWPLSAKGSEVVKITTFGMDAASTQLWLDYAARKDFTGNPCSAEVERRSKRPFTATRSGLAPDRAWYGSHYYNEFRRSTRSDDLLVSVLPMPAIGIAHGFGGDRPLRAAPMGRREALCSDLIHRELADRWRRLLDRPAGAERGLPPRLRELLGHLRGSDSERQIATRMGLSPHTVHNHVRRLYARFGVHSRPELIHLQADRPIAGVPRLGCAGL